MTYNDLFMRIESLVQKTKDLLIAPLVNGQGVGHSMAQWLEKQWNAVKQNPQPYTVGAVVMVGIGSLLLNVKGHYKVRRNLDWQERTFPQLIETIHGLMVVTELRGDPRKCLSSLVKLWNYVKKFRYKRVLFGVDQIIRPNVVSRLNKVLARLWVDAPADIGIQDEYFQYFQQIRVIMEPHANELDEIVAGGLTNQGSLNTYSDEISPNLEIDVESFLTPEMVLLSIHDTPDNVVRRIVDFLSQGAIAAYEEQVMLRSRPEITLSHIRRVDAAYQMPRSPLYTIGKDVEEILNRYSRL